MSYFANISIEEVLSSIKQKYSINDNDILCLYDYGSYVYGVSNPKSDRDFLAIIKSPAIIDDHISMPGFDICIYSPESFQEEVDKHEISALECLFLNSSNILKQEQSFNFTLDLSKLRESIASKSSHSFVKARKKLRFGEVYIGKKSMWHSFRIIYFGIQLAKYGKIIDYSAANHLYNDIVVNENNTEQYYKDNYLKLHNSLMTEFRKLAPKLI